LQYPEVIILETFDDYIKDIFPKRVKWLRERKGLSQRDAAEKLKISQPYYSKFEKGTAEPNLSTLVLMKFIFDDTLDFILGMADIPRFANESWENFLTLRNTIESLKARLDLAVYTPDLVELGPEFDDLDEYKEHLRKVIKRRTRALIKSRDYVKLSIIDVPGVSSGTLNALDEDFT
jgi:transcriptional regulator with XRE-family HTH domain